MNPADLPRHMDRLFRQALQLTGSTDDARDLTQETLLAALRSPAEPENPEAWLSTVLRRRHADLLRRRYRLPMISIDCVPEPPAPVDDTESAQAAAARVRREVAFLAGKYREAIVRHYLLGEKVADVALALDVPRGTVLSRLSAGRTQLRKGLIIMEDYGTQSYQPERLDVSCHGTPGRHDEPWSLVDGDLLKQNILIAAYEKPVTPVDVARHLGVPAAYVEAAVDMLVSAGLMAPATCGRVFTDFLITTPAQMEKGVDCQLRLVQQHYEALLSPVRAMAEAVCAQACNVRMMPDERRKLREYFTLHLLSTALWTAMQRLVPAEETFPDRPDGGRWIASGFRCPMEHDWSDTRFHRYTYGGERSALWEPFMDAKSVMLRIYDVQPALNRYLHGPAPLEDGALCRLLYILHRHLPLRDTGLDPALMQNIPHLIDCRVLREVNGRPECAVPVLPKDEYAALDAVRLRQLPVLADALEPLLRSILPDLRVPLPAHLTGRVAEFRRYSCYAIPLALREECIRRGAWSADDPAPPMVLVTET